MPSLQIRDLPDDVYQALALRAEREHRSLTQQALVDLRHALGPDTRSQRARVLNAIRNDLAAAAPGGPTPDAARPVPAPEDLVRSDRER